MRSECHLFFETLGTKLKMDIIENLRNKPLPVNELTKRCHEERSKVSHALLSLLQCGFVHAKKDGKKRLYSLNKDTVVPLLDLAETHVKKYCRTCSKIKRGRLI